MPKGPLKTPFTDYVVDKAKWTGDVGGWVADGDNEKFPLIIGYDVEGVSSDLFDSLGNRKGK